MDAEQGPVVGFVDATPFFTQVNSLDADILAEPMRIHAKVNGSDVDFAHRDLEVIETSPQAVVFRQRFGSEDGLILNINGRLEYDGFAHFKMEIESSTTIQVEQLFFEMPVKKQHALFAHGQEVYPLKDDNYVKNSHRGFVGDEDLSWMFTFNAYLGDNDRYLAWQAESDQDWAYAEKYRALEVLPREGATTFRARIIDVPTEISPEQSRQIEFAILATPTKPPRPSSWEIATARSEPYGRDMDWADRRMADGTPTLDNLKRLGVKRLLMTGSLEIWPYPMPVTENFSRMLKRNVEAIHASGVEVINYVLHQRFPVNLPEFEFNAPHMVKRPYITYSAGGARSGVRRPGPLVKDYGVPSQDTFFVFPKSRALQDAYIYSMHQRLKTFEENGVYLDGTSAHVPPCKNLLHGCGYLDAEGKVQATRPVFAVREYARRIYLATRSVDPDNKVDVHCSFGYNPSALGYADSIWSGEHWWHLRGKGTDYVHGELPLDMFRSEFTGRQLNIPVDMLTHRLGSLMKILATSLLHDVPVRSSVDGSERILDIFEDEPKGIEVLSRLWRLRREFGAEEENLRLYYENNKWVTCNPTGCFVTLLVHPRNGVLAFVTNLTRERQSVRVKFDVEKLGLAGGFLDIVDTMYATPLSLEGGRVVTLDLDSEQWTYLWLKPKIDKE